MPRPVVVGRRVEGDEMGIAPALACFLLETISGKEQDVHGEIRPGVHGRIGAGAIYLDRGQVKLDDLTLPMNMASDTVDAVLASRPPGFSWRALTEGKPPSPRDLRRLRPER
jgi:hypothetical protein